MRTMGSVALRMRSPSFSSFMACWNGSCSSLPVMTMLGKSNRCTCSSSRAQHSFKMSDGD